MPDGEGDVVLVPYCRGKKPPVNPQGIYSEPASLHNRLAN